jgi:hypothetical protein
LLYRTKNQRIVSMDRANAIQTKRIFRVGKARPGGPDLVGRAEKLLSRWMDGDDSSKKEVARVLSYAGQRVARDIGYNAFLPIFNNSRSIKQAGDVARRLAVVARAERGMSLYSESYATIAVVCDHALGRHKGNATAEKIARMAAELYGVARMTMREEKALPK